MYRRHTKTTVKGSGHIPDTARIKDLAADIKAQMEGDGRHAVGTLCAHLDLQPCPLGPVLSASAVPVIDQLKAWALEKKPSEGILRAALFFIINTPMELYLVRYTGIALKNDAAKEAAVAEFFQRRLDVVRVLNAAAAYNSILQEIVRRVAPAFAFSDQLFRSVTWLPDSNPSELAGALDRLGDVLESLQVEWKDPKNPRELACQPALTFCPAGDKLIKLVVRICRDAKETKALLAVDEPLIRVLRAMRAAAYPPHQCSEAERRAAPTMFMAYRRRLRRLSKGGEDAPEDTLKAARYLQQVCADGNDMMLRRAARAFIKFIDDGHNLRDDAIAKAARTIIRSLDANGLWPQFALAAPVTLDSAATLRAWALNEPDLSPDQRAPVELVGRRPSRRGLVKPRHGPSQARRSKR